MSCRKPFTIIDFEACSLGSNSYPIEVGIALAHDDDQPPQGWSTLIQPHSSWSSGAWDHKAERVHGIPREDLANGLTASHTLARLNKFVGPLGTAYCDGGDFDRFWFNRLCRAAPLIQPEFQLADISDLLAHGGAVRIHYEAALALTAPPHRAGPDAKRLCQALIGAGVLTRGLAAAPTS